MTFSSLFCVSFASKKSNLSFSHQSPVESFVIIVGDFYVDDFLKSVNDPAETISVARGLRGWLKSEEFRSTKRTSNSMNAPDETTTSEPCCAFICLGVFPNSTETGSGLEIK